jgi:hypothetical protein
MGRARSTYEGEEGCIQGFGGETLGKRPLERPRPRWEDNIKMDLRKWDVEAWTGWVRRRIGTEGGHLGILLYKMRGIS